MTLNVLFKNKKLRLKSLSDAEYDRATQLARMSGVALDQCPTCLTKETEIPDSGGIKQFINGSYRYRGEVYPCECQAQIALRSRYLLANIGEEYMRLDWADYDGCSEGANAVSVYLAKWESFKRQGFGLEFGGRMLGVGKTFAATHIGKELIKYGQAVYFLPFKEMVAAFDRDDHKEIHERIRTTTYLILDEVLPPSSDRQRWFFGDQFEALIRHRTNHNLPTIITTNLLTDELEEAYPRTYSLLSAKQWRVEMTGTDRRSQNGLENLELAMNDEVRPIT